MKFQQSHITDVLQLCGSEYNEIHSEHCSSDINGITIKQFFSPFNETFNFNQYISVSMEHPCVQRRIFLSITGKILYLPSSNHHTDLTKKFKGLVVFFCRETEKNTIERNFLPLFSGKY